MNIARARVHGDEMGHTEFALADLIAQCVAVCSRSFSVCPSCAAPLSLCPLQVLDSEKREYEKILAEWKLKCEAVEKRDQERRHDEQQKHKEEVDFLNKHNLSLKKELEQLLSIPSSLSS